MLKKTKTRENTQKEQIISSIPCPLLHPFLAHTTTTHWRKLSTPSELLPTKNHTIRGKKNTINSKSPTISSNSPLCFSILGLLQNDSITQPNFTSGTTFYVEDLFPSTTTSKLHTKFSFRKQTNKSASSIFSFHCLLQRFMLKPPTHPIYTHTTTTTTTTNTHVKHLNRNRKGNLGMGIREVKKKNLTHLHAHEFATSNHHQYHVQTNP